MLNHSEYGSPVSSEKLTNFISYKPKKGRNKKLEGDKRANENVNEKREMGIPVSVCDCGIIAFSTKSDERTHYRTQT